MEKKIAQIKSQENLRNDKQMINTISKKIDKHINSCNKKKSPFEAIYLFGLVGWELGIPILIMSYIGIWLEKKYPSNNLTLNFIILGFFIGFYNVYKWIKKEKKRLEERNFC